MLYTSVMKLKKLLREFADNNSIFEETIIVLQPNGDLELIERKDSIPMLDWIEGYNVGVEMASQPQPTPEFKLPDGYLIISRKDYDRAIKETDDYAYQVGFQDGYDENLSDEGDIYRSGYEDGQKECLIDAKKRIDQAYEEGEADGYREGYFTGLVNGAMRSFDKNHNQKTTLIQELTTTSQDREVFYYDEEDRSIKFWGIGKDIASRLLKDGVDAEVDYIFYVNEKDTYIAFSKEGKKYFFANVRC